MFSLSNSLSAHLPSNCWLLIALSWDTSLRSKLLLATTVAKNDCLEFLNIHIDVILCLSSLIAKGSYYMILRLMNFLYFCVWIAHFDRVAVTKPVPFHTLHVIILLQVTLSVACHSPGNQSELPELALPIQALGRTRLPKSIVPFHCHVSYLGKWWLW